ncbi:cell envelope integrity protein TolA [Alteromonas pelagimontana]|uniref:Cell envelope integrity protein TolA n=1 Tax=Alteromonas pelagimontana TaxID=1858656 RepID=A0A6M4MI62_9ALTE|nr:cell envelope integrity protein TolA [Alteromonas pelagimontana]QJR82712.1 cell envelope integrity protein TolA [Alteromonas pelagimontana]
MTAAIYKSVGVHLLIAAVLLISVSFSHDPLPAPATNAPVIKATFIDAQAIADQKRAKEQAEAQARAKEQEAERQRQAKQAAERQRQKEAAAKQAAQKRAQEKRQAEEAEKQRQLELKELAAQQAKERKEKEAQERAAAEKRRKEAQEKAEMERIMQEQLAAEQAAQQQRRAKQVMSEVERYQALIQQTIMRYLIEDSNFDGKRCRLNIRLATTGLVTKVSVVDGDPALCRAAQSAVLRPDRMPMSEAPDVYAELKNINLTVEL